MKKYSKKFLIFTFLIAAGGLLYLTFGRLVTFEAFKRNSLVLSVFVQKHYLLALFALASAFVSTAFCVPGALMLTIGSGYLFGAGAGALYACLFLTGGSTLAFLASRHLIGNSIQDRFGHRLERFNREMRVYGRNYLFVLRVLPVMPAFLLNYLCGLTEMPVGHFAFGTFFGLLPGAVVYSFAGRQLATMQSTRDILSLKVLIGIGLMAVLALLPVLSARVKPRTTKQAVEFEPED